jgi:sugar phosphate isomerase/epimerase
VILEEVQPGQGIIDFGTFFSAIDKLPQAVPMMVEHLSTEQEYDDAAAHIRSEVKKAGITI